VTNWKGFGRKRSWPHFKLLFWHSPYRLRKTTKNLSKNSLSPSRDLNRRPPKYKAGMLSTRPRFLIPKRKHPGSLSAESRYPQRVSSFLSTSRACSWLPLFARFQLRPHKFFLRKTISKRHAYPLWYTRRAHTNRPSLVKPVYTVGLPTWSCCRTWRWNDTSDSQCTARRSRVG
jgi:hypothetical protein